MHRLPVLKVLSCHVRLKRSLQRVGASGFETRLVEVTDGRRDLKCGWMTTLALGAARVLKGMALFMALSRRDAYGLVR